MARLDRRSNHDVHRGAPNTAHGGGLSLEDWMDQANGRPGGRASTRDDGILPTPPYANRSYRTRAETGGDEGIQGLSQRLESLSSRLDRLSGNASVGEDAPRGGARKRRNTYKPDLRTGDGDRDGKTGSMLDMLNTLDERVNAMAERVQKPQGNPHDGGRTQPYPHTDGNLDVDLKSAVSEIARKQKQLQQKSARANRQTHRNRPQDPAPHTSAANSMENHFSDLAARIDALRREPDTGPIVDLRNEVSALRSEIASQARGPDRREDISQIQEILRSLETAVGANPGNSASGRSTIDDVREEIADLRRSLASNGASAEVASLRDGHESILNRLEGIQSSVGDPQLYHNIADRLTEVRKALRAIPKAEHASALENQISLLADQIEAVGTQVDSLPLDTLQSQVFEIQGALKTLNSSDAIRDLDGKLRALTHKIDTLEDGLSISTNVSNRVASLETLIRSQPSAAIVAGRLDQLQELLLEKNSHDAVHDLESRIAKISEKLEFAGPDTNSNDMLAALDGRIVDLCARFDSFSTSFEEFTGSQNSDGLNPQIEMIAARIESLAEALVDGKSMEPIRRDISDLRKELADGDRAVVDLAERIGRIGDRLERFAALDGEDGKLGQLSGDLVQLQQQISDGDTVVFEILKRVGALEKTLNESLNGTRPDNGGLSTEITEIRDRLASGDETLTNIANRMESLLASVNVVASEPGLLSEIEPVQNDFTALQAELTEGNRVARDVLNGLGAIDERLNNLAAERAENSDIARLSDEIATLRNVVQATDQAAISELNSQISVLAERLDRAPAQGSGEVVFQQLEHQVVQLSAKLAATESQLGDLSSVTAKLDRIDEMLMHGRGTAGDSAGDNSVAALQSDLKRLQSSANKSDDSFGVVQDALSGIADRLSALESNQSHPRPNQERRRPAPERFDADAPELLLEPEMQVRAARTNPAEPSRPANQPDAPPAADRVFADNRPLEPGSGKPPPSGPDTDQYPNQADAPRAPGRERAGKRMRPSGDRAEFLAAARDAAKRAAAETNAQSISEEKKPKLGWLARAASLRNRKPQTATPDDPRHEPKMSRQTARRGRVSVLDDDLSKGTRQDAPGGSPSASAAMPDAASLDSIADAPTAGRVRKHARTILAVILAIAVVLGGMQAVNTYLGGGLNLAGLSEDPADTTSTRETGETDPNATEGPAAPADQSLNSGDQTPPSSNNGSTSDTNLAFSPPSGLESKFGDKTVDTDVGSLQQPAPGPRQIPVTGDRSPAPDNAQAALGNAATQSPPVKILPDQAVGPLALREAAANGDALAQFEIASRYMEGRTVPQNLPKAVEWYSKAAAKGFAQAQYRLGSMFEKGLGIPKDLQSARSWYTRAADKGNAKAIHNLAVLHAEGGLGERNFNRATQWFIQAANYGVTDSQYNLGILYAQGLGVERNMSESYKWFALAAKAGDADAGRKRDAIARDLDEDQKSRARIAVSSWKPAPIDPASNNVPAIPKAWQGAGEASVPAKTSSAGQTPLPDLAGALSSQAMISQVQKSLASRGYNPGPADGRPGPQTQNAVKAFQRSAGLPVTGIIDATLLNALSGEAI